MDNGILSITTGIKGNKEKEENFINIYGTLTLEQVIASELQYIDGESRYAQDTYMLYKCLMALLTSEAKKKVLIWSNQYKIGENKTSSGVALLKIIIRESHLDTKQQQTRSKPNFQVWIPTLQRLTVTLNGSINTSSCSFSHSLQGTSRSQTSSSISSRDMALSAMRYSVPGYSGNRTTTRKERR
jgi:hypothetical protein